MSAGVFVGMYAILLPCPQSILFHFCFLEATFDLPPDGCWLFFPGPSFFVCLLVFRSGYDSLPVMVREASSLKESQFPAESPREITMASQHCQIPLGKETQEAASLSFPSLGLANLLSGSLEGTTSYLWHKPPCPCFSGLVCLEGRKLVAALCGKHHLLGPSASSTWSCSPRESVVGLDWQREASEHIYSRYHLS